MNEITRIIKEEAKKINISPENHAILCASRVDCMSKVVEVLEEYEDQENLIKVFVAVVEGFMKPDIELMISFLLASKATDLSDELKMSIGKYHHERNKHSDALGMTVEEYQEGLKKSSEVFHLKDKATLDELVGMYMSISQPIRAIHMAFKFREILSNVCIMEIGKTTNQTEKPRGDC
jgi:hypothetical protein